jgi:phospholipid-binding lipoprotein MlaA
MRGFLRAAAMAIAAALPLTGCAGGSSTTAAGGVNDPYEPMNRFFYKVNDAIDAVVLRPASLAYVNAVPAPARTGVHNVLNNLDTPILFVNDLLQGRPGQSGNTLMRFVINTTIGLVGVFDVAKGWGYPYEDTDFGITLAIWGVPSGPFLFLPVLGPSNPRDAVGYGVDAAGDPLNYIGKGSTVSALRYARFGLYAIDRYSGAMDQLQAVEKTALDPYATLRSLYTQSRDSEISMTRSNGKVGPSTP